MVRYCKSFLLLIVCLAGISSAVNVYMDTVCVPGKITGQPCPTVEQILDQCIPLVNNVRENLWTKSKEYFDRINSLRGLLLKHNIDSKNDIRTQIFKLRQIINMAKQETVTSPPAVQACVRKQEFELNKIQGRNALACSYFGNLASLSNIRHQILKLEQSITGSLVNCQRLNPLQSQVYNLKNCILSRVKDINKQIQMMDREFGIVTRNVMKTSLVCNMRTSEEIFEDMSYLFGALKDCRYATF